MRKVVYALLGIGLFAHGADAQTMRQQHDNFLECMTILNNRAETIDQLMKSLHMSSMTADKNGWISFDIVEAAETRINFWRYQWEYNYTHRRNAQPEICQAEVDRMVDYVSSEVNRILSLR